MSQACVHMCVKLGNLFETGRDSPEKCPVSVVCRVMLDVGRFMCRKRMET